jgi:hypothetical protein
VLAPEISNNIPVLVAISSKVVVFNDKNAVSNLYIVCIVKEKHKLVHTIYKSLDRESNPRPLAYGNTASIEGTTTLTSCGMVHRGISRRVLRDATYDSGH